jgi:hypothetical protein
MLKMVNKIIEINKITKKTSNNYRTGEKSLSKIWAIIV